MSDVADHMLDHAVSYAGCSEPYAGTCRMFILLTTRIVGCLFYQMVHPLLDRMPDCMSDVPDCMSDVSDIMPDVPDPMPDVPDPMPDPMPESNVQCAGRLSC